MTSIEKNSFYGCSSLISISIPNSVVIINQDAFCGCSSLKSITIPNSVTTIGARAFANINFNTVYSQITNPFIISTNTFNDYTFNNAILKVPNGKIELYKSTEGWKKFSHIVNSEGLSGLEKCATPTISYVNNLLIFSCSTEGATCQSIIRDTDINSYSTNEVQLTITYNISVYATKAGFDDSDVATATLCWIDKEPVINTDISNAAEFTANAVLIQNNGGTLTIQGAQDGTPISVYTVAGMQAGTAISQNSRATISTSMQQGDIAIIKIGERSVKLVMK